MRDAREYLGFLTYLFKIFEQPLVLTDTKGTFDITVNVRGGGLSGKGWSNSFKDFSCIITCKRLIQR